MQAKGILKNKPDMNYITTQQLKIQQVHFSFSFELPKERDFHYQWSSFN
jgi:hypothetical protein